MDRKNRSIQTNMTCQHLTKNTEVNAQSGSHQDGRSVQEKPLQSLFKDWRSTRYVYSTPFGTIVESALRAILATRLRCFLTMLGMAVGVAAVIGTLTLTQGVAAFITNVVSSQGANTLYIAPSVAKRNGVMEKQDSQSLTLHDLSVLKNLPHVTAISPLVSTGVWQVIYGSQNWRTDVQGVNTDLQAIQNWNLLDGLWFTSRDQENGATVAVLGYTVAQKLFADTGVEPVGQQIRIGDQLFRVVGVLAPKGGFGYDDIIYIPYKTAMIRLNNITFLNGILVDVDKQDNVALVVQEVTTALELSHRISQGAPDDFRVTTSNQVLQQFHQITQSLAVLLSSVGAISLIVGGIGIMNIMLVSVTERRREIGIRLAVGAKRADICWQFLIEALVLALPGGLFGMLLGVFVGWLTVGLIIASLAAEEISGNVPLIITPLTLILPFAVSALVGVVFGFYPALQASLLDPVVALHRTR